MVAPTETINDVTYSATTESTTITLSDADFAMLQGMQRLTNAITLLARSPK